MKLRSAPLDDVYGELDFVLRTDGGFVARTLLSLFRSLYGLCHSLMLAVLRLSWRHQDIRGAADADSTFPAIGEEPFNLSATELEENW